jgi:UDP-glucose 4-epimerase
MGSHVARALLDKDHEVVVVDDLSGGFADNVPDGAVFQEGSVVDYTLMESLFETHEFEYVFHLAAYAAEGLSHHIRRFNYENNVVASAGLISLSLKHLVRRFVFTSSIAVYGEAPLPMREDMPMRPVDPYGIAKMAVELDLRSAFDHFGLEYTVFRPHNVYGENQNIGDRYRNVVGIFMNQIMSGQPMTIFGDGTQTRAFSYIADVAPVIASSVTESAATGAVLNIGADEPHSVLKLAHMVAHAFGVEAEIEFLPDREEVDHAYSSHEALRSMFDLPDPTPLEVGISRMAEWAQRVGPRSTRTFDNIEVTRLLPPSWEV